MRLNVEGDELAYRAAAACQKQAYRVVSLVSNKIWDLKNRYTKTDLVKKLADKGKRLDQHYTLDPYIIIEEDYIAHYTIDRAVEALKEFKHKGKEVKKVQIWLGGAGNFRYSLASLPGPSGVGYKAGRSEKPHHLAGIKERLKSKWGAQEIHGYEADDALGIYQEQDTVAVHQDKDINMIPGTHYNFVTNVVYEVLEGDGEIGNLTYENKKLKGCGLKFFYAQLLIGDRTDNIPGIKGVGDKTAYDLLEDIEEESTLFDIVWDQYQQYYQENAQAALEEVADLVWIVRADRLTGRQYLLSRGFIK